MKQPDMQEVERIVAECLAEDYGREDITTETIIPHDNTMEVNFVARETLVISGLSVIAIVFDAMDGETELSYNCNDGDLLEKGAVIARLSGNSRAILTGERVALNLLQRMSAVATITRQYVNAIDGTNAKILDTRKTMPCLRELDKYAVRCGGGYNHRMRLDDGVLIKDNHIAVCGGITEAVDIAKKNIPSMTKIEVECDTLEQVAEAVSAGADVIMLDNMSPEMMREAVALVAGRVKLEASGNVNLDTISAIAKTGVDYISVGKITHSAANVDIGLDVV